MSFKVVVTDGRMPHYNFERDILKTVDAELVLSGIPYGSRDDEALKIVTRDADALLVSQAQINRDIINSLEKCKIIVRYGIGIDTLDIQAATDKGIMVANVVDHCITEVADTALALIMGLARKTTFSARQVLQGMWGVANLKPIHRISTMVLGIMGCGRIGRETAKKAVAIGFQVIGYDPYLSAKISDQERITLVSYDKILRSSDIISLHMPLSDETKGMINAYTIKKMKKGAAIVNVSRGALIDELALADAICTGQIGGAGLDVTCMEPIGKDNPLLTFDNVIVTAHTAWYSDESNEELQQKAAQVVADALVGKPIKTLLNREVLNGRVERII
jgi:D-3-phosphoglycerate dehydrogenase